MRVQFEMNNLILRTLDSDIFSTHPRTHTHTHTHIHTHAHTHTHVLAPMRHSKPKGTHEGRHEKENPPKEQTSSDKRMDNNNNNTRDKFRRIFGFRKGSRMRFSCFGLLIGGLTAGVEGRAHAAAGSGLGPSSVNQRGSAAACAF